MSTPFFKLASILSASTPSGLSDGWEAAKGLDQNRRTDDPFPGEAEARCPSLRRGWNATSSPFLDFYRDSGHIFSHGEVLHTEDTCGRTVINCAKKQSPFVKKRFLVSLIQIKMGPEAMRRLLALFDVCGGATVWQELRSKRTRNRWVHSVANDPSLSSAARFAAMHNEAAPPTSPSCRTAGDEVGPTIGGAAATAAPISRLTRGRQNHSISKR